MTNCKKAVLLFAFWSVSALSFGQHYLGYGTSVNYFTEKYTIDNYTRKQFGWNASASYNFFPPDFPLGIFSLISYGSTTPATESIPRESMKARKGSITDIRFVIGPSFRFRLDSGIFFPLSVCPLLLFTRETSTERLSSGSQIDYSYQSLSGGIQSNFGAVFPVSNIFFIKPGVLFDYIFLRAEKGEMRMNYRTTHIDQYKKTGYYSFNLAVYFCIGIKF